MPSVQSTDQDTSEAAIFGRLFTNGKQTLTLDLARHVLGMGFSAEEKARVHELAVKNQEGRIEPEELRELDSYIKVGDILAILQSKARKILKAKSG